MKSQFNENKEQHMIMYVKHATQRKLVRIYFALLLTVWYKFNWHLKINGNKKKKKCNSELFKDRSCFIFIIIIVMCILKIKTNMQE